MSIRAYVSGPEEVGRTVARYLGLLCFIEIVASGLLAVFLVSAQAVLSVTHGASFGLATISEAVTASITTVGVTAIWSVATGPGSARLRVVAVVLFVSLYVLAIYLVRMLLDDEDFDEVDAVNGGEPA